jgi:hypothetical protein
MYTIQLVLFAFWSRRVVSCNFIAGAQWNQGWKGVDI